MIISDGSTLLFIGDSITDTGRARPVGQGDGLGTGYVSLVDGLLAAHHPDKKIKVLNTGISGNRVIDLKARWQEDVLDLEPDWLTIMIGINDVWRHFDRPLMQPQVDLQTFLSTYDSLIARTLPDVQGIVLLTPYFIEKNGDDPMRKMMDEFGAAVKELAKKHGVLLGDTQAYFDAYLEHNSSQSLCGDRVHPNRKGHSIIASAFLDTIGFQW